MQENIAIFFAPTARFTSRFYKYRLYLQKNGKQILLFTNIHGRRQNVFQGVHKHYFCFRGVQTFLILEAHLIFHLHEGHDLHKSTMSCASKAKKAILFANVHGFIFNIRVGITSAEGASENLV